LIEKLLQEIGSCDRQAIFDLGWHNGKLMLEMALKAKSNDCPLKNILCGEKQLL